MSFPKSLRDTFSASEINYLAENEPVLVISNVNMDSIPLITMDLTKLKLMNSYSLPLWLAIILKKQNKVTVTPPSWLNETNLSNKYQEETLNPTEFSRLPDKWMEISRMFIRHFQSDLIDDANTIYQCIQDLREIRMTKLRKGLTNMNEINLSFNNLSLMEINEFRPFISKVMGTLNRLESTVSKDQELVEDEEDEEKPLDTPLQPSGPVVNSSPIKTSAHEDLDMIVNNYEL